MSADSLARCVVTIGAMKCGTSSLHEYLDLHPEVSMSRTKELNYFLGRHEYARGERWYRRQLAARDGARVVGESSPNYTKTPVFGGVAERLHGLVPHARLIYIVRDPLKRTLSHYVHNVAHGRERRSVDEAFATLEGNPYVDPSRYMFQLEAYRRWFPDDRILVLSLEELSAAPRPVLARVFTFLGVDAEFDHPDFGVVHHASSQKSAPNALGRFVQSKVPFGKAVRHALPALFESPFERPRFSDATIARLRAVFEPDLAALSDYAGVSVPCG